MKRSNVPSLLRTNLNVRLFYLVLAIIIFIVFRNLLSYYFLIISIVGVSWSYYYENCISFYIKSQSNSVISPKVLTMVISQFSFPLYIFISWIILNELTLLILKISPSFENILNLNYWGGMQVIISAIFVIVVFRTLHYLVFKEMEKKAHNNRMEAR